MSIFFDFDVGVTGRRFRRAVDADKYDIELFCDKRQTEKLFGIVDIGRLIELSVLSICMINEKKEVIGFIALNDHPNVPCVDPADWEVWMRIMFQRFYLSRNTLFIHFMYCVDSVADIFLEEALISVFNNDDYLLHIVLMVPSACPLDIIMRYYTFKKRNIYKYKAKRLDDVEDCHHHYLALRQDFCPKLRIRRAVEEDNDDIVAILDKKCPKLKELYGEYYISEIIGRHPSSTRKIIVAELQDRAVGVMCLNGAVNYKMLQKTYELRPYYGLKKSTPLEKEHIKRGNSLLKTFGEPIMLGKWTPFENIRKLETKLMDDEPSQEKLSHHKQPNKAYSKVNFVTNSSMRRSMDHLYMKQHNSDDISDKYMLSPTPSQATNYSYTFPLLDDDPFDYEIVNIDTTLLTIPEVSSYDYFTFKPTTKEHSLKSRRRRTSQFFRRKSERRASIYNKYTTSDETEIRELYEGEPNAFIIELFGLQEDIGDLHCFDLLEAAFEIMKPFDYCLIRVPCAEKTFAMLQHFCFIPTKAHICCEYSLYIAHRSSVLGKLRVRRAEFIDIPQITKLINNVNGKETIWTIENSIKEHEDIQAFVFISGTSLIGFGIIEPSEKIDFIRANYNLDAYHNNKYHYTGHGIEAGFATLKVVLSYPVFEVHFRFFSREMMRLSGSNSLLWLTAYRNKWVAHKANSMASVMLPLMPRKFEIDSILAPELRKIINMSKNIMSFTTWFLDKKLTSVPRVEVNTRIVIIGSSMTAMGFLNTLLFSDSATYLTFTNVTLISPNGLPYMKQWKSNVQTMFPRFRTNTSKFLKSVPYTYYVNVIQDIMVEMNIQDKYVTLGSGRKCRYDLLFILFGKQYQHPEYLKAVFERESDILYVNWVSGYGNRPLYTRLDVPRYSDIEYEILNYDIPDNVFIVNNMADANKSLNYAKQLSGDDYKILVYGATLETYCCLTTLLEMNVPPECIIYIEPFPPENSKKTRIPVFCNVYVDQTVREILKNLKVTIYSSYYFQSWNVIDNLVTHVEFLSHFKMLRLECAMLFYYGTRGVNVPAFIAMNKGGLAYDGGILIDHQFKTKDPAIYAAGPATRYHRRYFAEDKRQKYYDSYEIGEKLGTHIRDNLDPLFTTKRTHSNSVRFSTENSVIEPQETCSKTSTITSTRSINSILSHDSPEWTLPDLKKPKVKYCTLPGGLQYLEVRAPGRKTPHQYVQSLEYNGFVMETFKTGYFKLHFTRDFIVDGITCLTSKKFSLENFKNLYGLSAVVLNNVHLKYSTKRIDDFYEFFRLPWAFFLYHDRTDELFAMVKELLPLHQPKGETLKEALNSIVFKLSHPYIKKDVKYKMRCRFETSPHVEAITEYVIEWLSENDVLLPMYFQPWQKADYMHDVDRNPAFKKKKCSVKKMLSSIL